MEHNLDTSQLIRKQEAAALGREATGRLAQLIKEQTARLEAEVAAPLVGRVVHINRMSRGIIYSVTAQITGVSVSYTGFRLLGEFVDPATSTMQQTTILIDELKQ